MKRLAISLCAAALLFSTQAVAETVKIIVPFAAGGPVDQLARLLGHELGPLLGADVIVEDKGGAGGAIQAEMGPALQRNIAGGNARLSDLNRWLAGWRYATCQ